MKTPDLPQTATVPSQAVTASSSGTLAPPRALLYLLHFLFTSHPIIKFVCYTGVFLLPVSLFGYFWSPTFAFGMGIYSYLAILVLPFLVAVVQQRILLGNRRLCLIPGFPLASGLTLLVMTTLLAAFLPLLGSLYGIQHLSSLLGIHVFVCASLYVAVLQFCLISRHALALLSFLPFLLILLIFQLSPYMDLVWRNPALMLLAFLLCLAVWGLALRSLHAGSSFKAPFQQTGALLLGYDYNQQFAPLSWQPRHSAIPSTPSLLLGFPAALTGRMLNMAANVLVSPLLCGVLMLFMWNSSGKDTPYPLRLFFLLHLFIVAIYPWAWGELAARSRLLWLRLDTDRTQLWQTLERQLWTQYAVMFSYTLAFLLTPLLLEQGPGTLGWYMLLLALSASLHNGYLNMLARLEHWNSWVQVLSIISFLCAICVGLGYVAFSDNYGPLTGISLGLLPLALWYRQRCKSSFASVDWVKLKPSAYKRGASGAT
jgi:hypothetical protein